MTTDEQQEERRKKTTVHMDLAQHLAVHYAGHRVLMVDVEAPEPDASRTTDDGGQN